jgi:hypothetical protein
MSVFMFEDKEECSHRNSARVRIKNSSYKAYFDFEEIELVGSNTEEDISKRHTGLRHDHG